MDTLANRNYFEQRLVDLIKEAKAKDVSFYVDVGNLLLHDDNCCVMSLTDLAEDPIDFRANYVFCDFTP